MSDDCDEEFRQKHQLTPRQLELKSISRHQAMLNSYIFKNEPENFPFFTVLLFQLTSVATSLIRNCTCMCVCVCVCECVCVCLYMLMLVCVCACVCILMLVCVYWFAPFICLFIKLLCVCICLSLSYSVCGFNNNT